MKNLFQSSATKKILWIIGVFVLVLLAFGGGMVVGYRKGLFSSRWGENYSRNFFGPPRGLWREFAEHNPWNTHGVYGSVIDVTSSTISVRDEQGNEKSVAVSTSTVVRKEGETTAVGSIAPGDTVAVIGAPNASGQIEARFIRIFAASSSPWGVPPPPPPGGPR